MWHFNKDIKREVKIGVGFGLSAWSFYLFYGKGAFVSSHFWPFLLASNAFISKFITLFIFCRLDIKAASNSQKL